MITTRDTVISRLHQQAIGRLSSRCVLTAACTVQACGGIAAFSYADHVRYLVNHTGRNAMWQCSLWLYGLRREPPRLFVLRIGKRPRGDARRDSTSAPQPPPSPTHHYALPVSLSLSLSSSTPPFPPPRKSPGCTMWLRHV